MRKEDLKNGELYESRFGFKERNSTFRFLVFLLAALLAVVGFRVWFTLNFKGVIVKGDSMFQTLRDNETLLMHTNPSELFRGDIIVVNVSGYPECQEVKDGFIIKRLIALEGDKLYCVDGQIYICYAGEEQYVPLPEPYAYYGENDKNKEKYDFDTYYVGEGEVFFLGDNRSAEGSSIDSRYREKYGSHLIGKLYKQKDIYGVVSKWAIENQAWIAKILFRA